METPRIRWFDSAIIFAWAASALSSEAAVTLSTRSITETLSCRRENDSSSPSFETRIERILDACADWKDSFVDRSLIAERTATGS